MADSKTVAHITDGLAKATFKDGALPTDVKLANNMLRTRAAVTNIKTHLDVVWYKPHCNVWLHFKERAHAEEAVEVLNGANVKGLKLRCDFKTTNKPHIQLYTAHVPDVVETIAMPDLAPLLRHQPVDSVFGAFNYPLETDEIKLIRTKIEEKVGEPIDDVRMVPTSNILKCKASFLFQSEAPNLAAAARSLNGTVVKSFGKSKIFVTEHLEIHLAIDNEIYLRHSKGLKGIASTAWKEHKIKVKIFDGELRSRRGTFLLRVQGNGREQITKVKSLIDTLVTEDAIAGLQRESQGAPRKYKVELKLAKDYKRAVNGGITRLQELVGKANVSFNDEEDPPSVTYKVAVTKASKARHILVTDAPAAGPAIEQCPICAEDFAELLVFPNCSHAVCTQCLKNYCSIDLSGDKLPLRCFVDPACREVLPTDWLINHLPNADSEQLFRNAIALHCREDPSSFMRCAGPDCNQYLTISPKFGQEVCPSCLTVSCTACKRQYHFEQTCQENQETIKREDEVVEKYVTERGGKRCPRCDEATLQNGGCNHMECPRCHVHYCWQCLIPFPNMGATYAHMHRVHGTDELNLQNLPPALAANLAAMELEDVMPWIAGMDDMNEEEARAHVIALMQARQAMIAAGIEREAPGPIVNARDTPDAMDGGQAWAPADEDEHNDDNHGW